MKSVADVCTNKVDPIDLEPLSETSDQNIVVLNLPNGEKQCFFVASLCDMVRHAQGEGRETIEIPHGRDLRLRAAIRISMLLTILKEKCKLQEVGKPLYTQVSQDLIVKMLLLIWLLNRSILTEEIEASPYYLPYIIFTQEEIDALLRLKYGDGLDIPEAFRRLVETCTTQGKMHICTKHGVAPLYRTAFFGSSENAEEQEKVLHDKVQKLYEKIKAKSKAESTRVTPTISQNQRMSKQEKQMEKASQKAEKLANRKK